MILYELNGDGLLIDGCPCDAEKMADEVREFVKVARPPMTYLYLTEGIFSEMEARDIITDFDGTYYMWGLKVKVAIRIEQGEEE
jgi:hypothetical protein